MRIAYSSQRADRVREFLTRTEDATTELAGRYTELHGLIIRGEMSTDEGATRAAFGSPPLRTDVVDVIRAIERAAADRVTLARGALRMGPLPRQPRTQEETIRALVWLSRALGPVYEVDPPTVRDTARLVWRLHSQAGSILRIDPHPFSVSVPCPGCGHASLWADPRTWRIACGMSTCEFSAPIDAPYLVWTTATSPTAPAAVVAVHMSGDDGSSGRNMDYQRV